MHEDKKYYPSAEEAFGADVEAVIQEEDAQPISQPIVAPLKTKRFIVQEKDVPEATFDVECVHACMTTVQWISQSRFLTELAKHPQMVRNIAIVGHLHHGKSSFVDCLVEKTHGPLKEDGKKVRQDSSFSESYSSFSFFL